MKATLCLGDQGVLTASPTLLDFGTVNVGNSKALTITFSNSGCTDLHVDGFAWTSRGGLTHTHTTCYGTIKSGATCTSKFTYKPTEAGSHSGYISPRKEGKAYVTANWKGIGSATIQKLTVSKAGSGTGTINSNPAGISCGSTCNKDYPVNSNVTLTAAADTGSTFIGWTGACSGTGSCTVKMDAAKTVVATFNSLPKYTLSVSKNGSGTITSSPAGINCGSDCTESYTSGTNVTLTATPDSNIVFAGWSGACTGTGSCTVSMNAAKTVSATFSTPPNIQPSPSSVNFGSVNVSRTYYKLLYIWNKGSSSLNIGKVTFSGANASEFTEYSSSYSCTNRTVSPNSYCRQYIRFMPTSAGTKSANLVIPSNDPDTPSLSIPLSATATEVGATADPACNLTPTITANAGAGLKVWARYNSSTGKYDAVPFGTWDKNRVPNKDDIVHIKTGVTMIGIPFSEVKALCVEKGATLKSMKSNSLEIIASQGIANYGSIIGNIDQHATTKDQGTCVQKEGNSVILKAGSSFSKRGKAGDWWWYGSGAPIYNNGLIEAAPGGNEGGNGIGCVGKGGDALVLGRNTTNDTNGIIRAGKGGSATVSNTITGGTGGLTQVWGKLGGAGNLLNKGQFYAGAGGNGCSGGAGGNLWIVSLPNVFLRSGSIHQSGDGGKALSSCPTGRNYVGKKGFVRIEPSVISLGANASVDGGEVTIFGGNDWTLDLSNANGVLVRATESITLQVGEGSVVNLSGNTVPVLQTDGEVKIYSDNILLDDGVQLSDVIKASKITVESAKILRAVSLTGANKLAGVPNTTLALRVNLANGGPTTDTYSLSVSDTAGWQLSAIEPSIEVEGIDSIDLALSITVPDALGTTNVVTVTATSQSDSSVTASTQVSIEVAEADTDITIPPPVAYSASGTITDQFGDVVSGAALTATDKADNSKVITSSTDDTGYWQLTGLDAGDYSLTVVKQGYTFTSTSFTVGDGNNAQVNIEAVKVVDEVIGKYTAHGTLKDQTGQSLVGVTVEVNGKTTVTDENGNWSIGDLIEGKYQVIATQGHFRCVNAGFEVGNQQYEQAVGCSEVTAMKVLVKPHTWRSIVRGESLVYTITVINGGDETATGVNLVNALSGAVFQGNENEIEIVKFEGSGGSVCNESDLTCTLPDMEPGDRVEVKLVVRALQAGDLRNTVTLTSNEYPVDKRGTTANGVKPYLYVTLPDDPKRVQMLSELSYHIVPELSELAPKPVAKDVMLEMKLTEETELVSIDTSTGSCDTSAYPNIVCELGDLPAESDPEKREAIDLRIKLTDPNLLVVLNKASISASNYSKQVNRERTRVVLPPVKVDAIFVLDTTNSMQEEKAAVIRGLNAFIDKQVELGVSPMVALIEFKDKVSLVYAGDDMQALKAKVESLQIEGGGMCPEASAEALDLALEHIKDNGTIIFSTDASPYPRTDINALIEGFNEKEVTFIPLVSGDCTVGERSWNDLEDGVN